VKVVRRLGHHVGQHLVAYIALFFALSGTAWAVGSGPPFVGGGGEITSSAALDVPATAVDLNTEELHPNEQGPAFLLIPDFGEYYLAGCWLIQGVGPEYVTSQVGYRNTTAHAVEGVFGVAQPGANIDLRSVSANDDQLGSKTTSSGHSPQTVTHIASVHWIVQDDLATKSCRPYSQVIIQPYQ
jgi:hypothetical protein